MAQKTALLVILVGLPGSGKSTLVERWLAPVGFKHVSQDLLGTRPLCEEAVAAALAAGENVVVDRVNQNAWQRRKFMAIARNAPGPVRCIAVFINAPPNACRARCEQRKFHPRLAPADAAGAIEHLRGEFELPSPQEGFDELYVSNGDIETDRLGNYLGSLAASRTALPGLKTPLPHVPNPYATANKS